MQKETIIISLGGSLVAPGEIDVNFLNNFKQVIEKYINPTSLKLRGTRFFILVGGGKVARFYQKALLEFGAKENERHLIGISITKLNAEVLKQVFGNKCHSKIIDNPTKKIRSKKSIVVGGGWKPGWSTDYVSALVAKANGAKTIINLTNIDHVYDKNPNEFPGAKPLKEISWKDFEQIIGNKWLPGSSAPFDPGASKLAEKLKIKVVIIDGRVINNFENFLNSKPFVGTTIQ